MRKFFTLLWLLFPVAVIYCHFNQGQTQMAREKARRHVAEIRALERAKEPNWESIVEEYDKVAAELPKDERPVVKHQIRLAKAKAKLEMLMLRRWREELAQTHAPMSAAHAAISRDEKTGQALRQLQLWLHRPGSAIRREDIAAAIAPQRSPARSRDTPNPTENAAPAAIAGPESRLTGSSSTSASMPISASCSRTMKRYARLVMTIGRSNTCGSDTRRSVSWKVERSPNSGRNCFGQPSRDAGHSRVPDPPHITRGIMRWTLDMDSSLGQGVLIGSPGNPVKSRALRAER